MITEKEYNLAVKEFSKNLYRYFLKSLRDEDAAKDLVQDAFLKLWSNRNQIDWGKLKSWLFSVAHNSMLNYLKQTNKKSDVEIESLNQHYCSQGSYEDKEIIEKSLESLPPLQKSIVLLRDMEGYNYKEIGAILDLSESQVKVYLFRARQQMKESIQQLMMVYEKRS
jgi:RNA polymerase sigma factor (sigma-70 family)